MKQETIPRVYAQALLDLVTEKGEEERVYEEAKFFAGIPRARPMTRAFFESPRITRSEKEKVVEAAFRGKLSDTFVNFLLLVVHKGRALFLRDMLDEFLILHDERIGVVHASAVSATALSDTAKQELQQVLEGKIQKRVEVHNTIDPEILGGLVVRYKGWVADGSLRTALQKIAANMRSVKLGSKQVHEN